MCLLWLHGDPDHGRLTAAFADALAVSTESVDVHDGAVMERNWDAPVLCTVERIAGDLKQALDVFFGKAFGPKPAKDVLAAALAERLGCAVAYEWLDGISYVPDCFWLVGPDGHRTMARINDDDDDEDGRPISRILAVEEPVAGIPGLPIDGVYEIIHNLRMPTPLTDPLRDVVTEVEKGRGATGSFWGWESMIARMEAGWPPKGWYPPLYYRLGLECRDRLAEIAELIPESSRAAFDEVLATLDRRFIEATVDDSGRALADRDELAERRRHNGWWRHRITRPVPWHRMPGEDDHSAG
ncbi:MAG TPA: hypothetical protein VN408_00380 [Actinoplanes sp.]|nr:hypothetical protein [Actinoplanes sp.]